VLTGSSGEPVTMAACDQGLPDLDRIGIRGNANLCVVVAGMAQRHDLVRLSATG